MDHTQETQLYGDFLSTQRSTDTHHHKQGPFIGGRGEMWRVEMWTGKIGTLEACGNAGKIGKRSGLKMFVFCWVGAGWWEPWVGGWEVGGMIGPNEVCFTPQPR